MGHSFFIVLNYDILRIKYIYKQLKAGALLHNIYEYMRDLCTLNIYMALYFPLLNQYCKKLNIHRC